ncbi:galactokinase [Treponema sp.]|uniref:galactokinase n=1 Tax=Treponema sp. TaxID=166 RepID=UPI00298EA232|nr:galactokinase family protein [Treponema sp.]
MGCGFMDEVNKAHKAQFGELPKLVVQTPGRFHLMGEHSWFCKDKTLSMAVNLPVYIAVSPRNDSSVHFYFHQLKYSKKTSLSTLRMKKEDRWANNMKAMIYGFTSGGFEVKGMNFTVYTDILPSAGFGITTAIKVGTAFAIRQLLKIPCSDAQLLQVIERGNKLFLRTGNYIADNYAALYSKPGNLILTDHATGTYDYVPFNFKDKKILLTDAKVPRISIWDEETVREPENVLLLGDLRERKNNVYGGWIYEQSATEINETLSVIPEDIKKKLLYIIKEHQFVLDSREAIINGNFGAFAHCVNQSHEYIRDLYNLSCPEIDWILKRVYELEPKLEYLRNPVTCGRITGKGFGRCLYAIVRKEDVPTYMKKLEEYERIFGFKPDTYEVKPAKGVHVVRN